jgi:hypothetical protein
VCQVLALGIHDGGARARRAQRGQDVDGGGGGGGDDSFCFPLDGLEFIVHRAAPVMRPPPPPSAEAAAAVAAGGALGLALGETLTVSRVIPDDDDDDDDDEEEEGEGEGEEEGDEKEVGLTSVAPEAAPPREPS